MASRQLSHPCLPVKWKLSYYENELLCIHCLSQFSAFIASPQPYSSLHNSLYSRWTFAILLKLGQLSTEFGGKNCMKDTTAKLDDFKLIPQVTVQIPHFAGSFKLTFKFCCLCNFCRKSSYTLYMYINQHQQLCSNTNWKFV